jgi:hypothetical protein
MSQSEIFSKYPTASWRVGDGEPLFFPVVDVSESGGNRIVQHQRPHRNGAKLEDTGSKARSWSVTAVFNNSIQEGVQNGVPLYPQRLRQILRSFDVHETGTLVLPTVGKVRARAETYERKESPEQQDSAEFTCTWIEDNEEGLDRAAMNPPSVVATLRKLSEQTVNTLDAKGIPKHGLSLTEFAAEVEGLLLAPGRSVSDLGAVIRSHRRALQRMIDAATTAADEGGGLFSEPRGSEAQRQLRILLDREAAAEDERVSSRPRTKAFVVDVEETSLFEIAARLDQDAEELMDLNEARVSDPFYLTRGEVIRVFESPPR